MNIHELRDFVKKHPYKDSFDKLVMRIELSFKLEQKVITGLLDIYNFISMQADGWSQYKDLPQTLLYSKQHFIMLKDKIDSYISVFTLGQGEDDAQSLWNDNFIGKVNKKTYMDEYHFLYDSSEVEFLVKIYKKQNDKYLGAFNYFTGKLNLVNNKHYFAGYILAYEFEMQGESSIFKRSEDEQISLDKTKRDYHKYFTETEKRISQLFDESKGHLSSYIKTFDDLKDQKILDVEKWYKNIKEKEWPEWHQQSQAKISELERTYSELLMLKQPAEYWQKRGDKLKTQGWWAFAWFLLLVALAAGSLSAILYFAPKQIYASFIGTDKSTAIRWSIVFVTYISFIAYGLRIIAKVMLSSFHLARDCEERYTLTYFYLSLIENSSVEEDDRHLIMQSLFSRADTGLLKEESSPSMPTSDILSKIKLGGGS